MDSIDITASAMSADLCGLTVEVGLLNEQGHLVAVNEAWETFAQKSLGSFVAGVVGESYADTCDGAVDQEAGMRLAAAIRSALRGEADVTPVTDVLVLTEDSERWLDIVVSTRREENGAVSGAVVMLIPATARKQAASTEAWIQSQMQTRLADAVMLLGTTLRDGDGPGDMYQSIVDAVVQLLHADLAVVNVPERDGESMVTLAASGALAHHVVGQRIPVSGSITGQVVSVGLPLLVADATTYAGAWQPMVAVANVGSSVTVPLLESGVVVGTLSASCEPGGRSFTDDDLDLLVRFAHHASLVFAVSFRLFGADPTAEAPRRQLLERRQSTLLAASKGDDVVDAATMVEASPDGMILTDGDGTIVMVNRQIEVMFGYDRATLLGQPVEVLVPARVRQRHQAHRDRYQVHPTSRMMGGGLDLLARRKDGSEFSIEVSLSPATSVGPPRVVATVRDASSRVANTARAQAVLHTMDATRDAVFMFAPDTLTFVYVNQGAMHQLGFSRDELLTMTPLDVMPDYTAQDLAEMLAPLLADELHTCVFSTVHRRKDGRDVPVEVVLEYPPTADTTHPRMLVALARDITDHLASARALATSEAAWRATFDDAPVGMAVASLVDPHQRAIVNANQALCEMLGYSHEELASMTFAELTHPDDRDPDIEVAQDMKDGARASYSVEKRYVRKDGRIVWATLHSTVQHGDEMQPARALAHIVDITNRKLAEAAAEQRSRWLAGLADIRAGLLASVPLEDTLSQICAYARDLVGAETALLSRPDYRSGLIRHLAVDSAATRDMVPETFVIDEPIRTVLSGRPFISGRIQEDQRVIAANKKGMPSGGGSVMIVPVRGDRSIDSLLFFSSRQEGAFDADDIKIVTSFAAEAATAVRLNEARQQQARLRVLEERERLGKDLHDVVIQRLFAAGIGLQSVQSLIPDEKAAVRVESTIDLIDNAIVELRSTIFRLNQPLPLAIGREISDIVDGAALQLGFPLTLTIHGDPESIPVAVVEQLLPAFNEALSNVLRHAKATAVAVILTVQKELLTCTIADDGVGIDADAVRGNGLNNLESRAQRVGGMAAIERRPEGGTLVTWTAALS